MNDRSIVVVPMKDLSDAKQRLAGAYSAKRRSELARTLFVRLIDLLKNNFPNLVVLVMTPSDTVAELAEARGCVAFRETGNRGLNIAAQRAANWSKAHGFTSQLLIHADIPELCATDIHAVLRHRCTDPSVIICPSRDNGTNLLYTKSPTVIPFCFGPNSCQAHVQAAQDVRASYLQLDLPRASRDVDTPADLAEYLTRCKPVDNMGKALCFGT